MAQPDEELDRPKYTVFKNDKRGQVIPSPLQDAVVIRLKDPFAATALFTYANTIMSFLELMPEETLSEVENDRMMDLADYFHGQAVESQKIKDKRLPD
jgi:hypothetical protein